MSKSFLCFLFNRLILFQNVFFNRYRLNTYFKRKLKYRSYFFSTLNFMYDRTKKLDLDFILKKLALLLTWLITYFTPVYEYLLIVGLLVFLDTYLGIRNAVKSGEFTSRKLESVVHKTVIYISAILLAHAGEKVFEIDLLLKITGGWIAYTELVSIDENTEKLLGYSIFGKIIKKIKREQ